MIINRKFIFGVIVMFSSVCVAGENPSNKYMKWIAKYTTDDGNHDHIVLYADIGITKDQLEVYLDGRKLTLMFASVHKHQNRLHDGGSGDRWPMI